MAQRKGPRIWTIDDIPYYFDNVKFKKLYKERTRKIANKNKGEFLTEIAENIHSNPETVRGWLKGNAGPSDPELVYALENFLKLERYTLLKSKKEQEEPEVRKIQDYERNAARELYALLCDLVADLEFRSDVLIEGEAHFRLLEKEPQPWLYCDQLIEQIRKVGFDLPMETREDLMVFVYETFEDGDRNGEMYYGSEWYKAFLQEEGREDTERSRVIFSIYYIEERYEALDKIFADYLTQKEK